MKTVYIKNAPVANVKGYYQGYIEMGDTEYEDFANDPVKWLNKNDPNCFLPISVDTEEIGEVLGVQYEVSGNI